MRNEIQKLIAKDLLSIKAVFFRPDEPFTWASGIKSPVYCDNRLTLTAPKVRDDVENSLAEIIKSEYPLFGYKREFSHRVGFSPAEDYRSPALVAGFFHAVLRCGH